MEFEQKSLALSEFETNSTPGEFIADFAVLGNVDRFNDRIMPDAFAKAISDDPPPPIIYNHQHDTPPMGETVEWSQVGQKAIRMKGQLFVAGDDDHPIARMAYAGMKSRGGRPPALRDFSFVYGVPAGSAEVVRENAKSIRNLHQIRPVAEVGPCLLGVNPQAGIVMAPKGLDLAVPLEQKADWTAAYVDALPDSAFLYVEAGGKLADGKTTPLTLRHFPYKDANGAVDLPHLRDAIDRAPTSNLPANVQENVQNRARKILAAQQGKAIVLSGLDSKAWDDIDGYCVSSLLSMLDDAVSYIQTEDDPGNVAQMQTVARSLLTMVDGEFAELAAGSTDETSAKSLWLAGRDGYMKGADLSSDEGVTVKPGEVLNLLLAR